MEKFSQFRDKGTHRMAPSKTLADRSGTAIAPFLPIPTEPAGIYLPFHIFLFIVRVPLLLTLTLGYFFVFQWLPIGNLGKRAALWSMMGVPGIWWIDLQVDGVRRGYGQRKNWSEQITDLPKFYFSKQCSASTCWLGHSIYICIAYRCPLPGCYIRPGLHRFLPINQNGRANIPLPGHAPCLFRTETIP